MMFLRSQNGDVRSVGRYVALQVDRTHHRYVKNLPELVGTAMAAAAADDGSSWAAGRVNSPRANRVRCLVHNFADDDDDVESTIRSLFEPDLIVHQCQPPATGLSDFNDIDTCSLVVKLASRL